jgi:hypothetical protein
MDKNTTSELAINSKIDDKKSFYEKPNIEVEEKFETLVMVCNKTSRPSCNPVKSVP